MKYVSLDYSMTCPCMCIMGESGMLWDAKFYYLTGIKKSVGTFLNDTIVGVLHQDHLTEQQRFSDIADFFMDRLPGLRGNLGKDKFLIQIPECMVMIEDYSFGSKGKVFHIAENTGVLKHKLWEHRFKFQTAAPTTIKKFATGKGNADKEQMYVAFTKETGVDLHKIMMPDKKLGSPVSDIIDAYFIARYLRETHIGTTSADPRGNTVSK